MSSISLHIPNRIYFGGEIIDGIITLKVTTPLQSRGIALSFLGFEKTRVKVEKRAPSKEAHTFLSKRLRIFVTKEKTDGVEQVPVGTYHIAFAFQLPPKLPASFKTEFAKVKYEISAYMHTPSSSASFSNTMNITIGGDLFTKEEFEKENNAPVIKVGEKKIILRGTVHAEVSIPKSNYYIGENIPLKVTTENNSKQTIRGMRAHMLITFSLNANSHEGSWTWEQIDKTKFTDMVPKHELRTQTLNFVVPEVIPTIAPIPEGNKNITSQHEIVLVFDVKHYPDFQVTIPLRVMRHSTSEQLTRCDEEIMCENCQTTIATFRYKCKLCSSYNLCYACHVITPSVHSQHQEFQEMSCFGNDKIEVVPFANMSRDKTNKFKKYLYPVGNFVAEELQDQAIDLLVEAS